MHTLAQGVLDGNRRALARALTVVENGGPHANALLSDLYPFTGRAWVIGVTGAPGTGKSSLVTALTQEYRRHGKTVGIVAVDPTSPFTGGAILGDRIRMRDLSGDAGVFIRSMATRGSLGGLARTTRDAVRLIDAAGFDMILVETVGAGQSEVDIVRTAHTTLVVDAPGMGDDVQAIKAGILEIADILIVNKADRPGADNTVRALRSMLELGHPTRNAGLRADGHHSPASGPSHGAEPASLAQTIWLPPVIRTIATKEAQAADDGIAELVTLIARHRAHLTEVGQLATLERERIEIELADRLRHALYERVMARLGDRAFSAIVDSVIAREVAPGQAVERILGATASEMAAHEPPLPDEIA